MSFRLNVLIVTVIISLFLLYIIYLVIVRRTTKQTWPTYVSNCPDYWKDPTGTGGACVSSVYNITDTCSGTKNFKGSYCEKLSKLSAYNCKDILWEGVTYGKGNLFEKNKCKTHDVKPFTRHTLYPDASEDTPTPDPDDVPIQ